MFTTFATRVTTVVAAIFMLAGLMGSGVAVAAPPTELATSLRPAFPAQGPVGPHCWGPNGWNPSCGQQPQWGPGMMGPGYWENGQWGPGMMGPGYGDNGQWGPGMMGPGYGHHGNGYHGQWDQDWIGPGYWGG